MLLASTSSIGGCARDVRDGGEARQPSQLRSSTSAPPRTPLTFVENDFARARAMAKASGRPIFVDAWAPWCHTCLSMRALTLDDPSLASTRLESGKTLAESFVWLSIDTERAENASFVAKFPNHVWPTLYVLASDGETVRLSWGGSATTGELASLLSDIDAGGARSQFAVAAAHMASGRPEEARRAFESLVVDERAKVGTRARAAEALATLYEKDPALCVALAKRTSAWMPPSSSRAAVLVAALSALDETKTTDDALVQEATKSADEAPFADAFVPDDRSGLFEALVSHFEARGRTAEKRALATRWAAFLEHTARVARTKEERFVYDAHRLLAAEALGDVDRVLPVLRTSAIAFPKDGNAHARLAKAFSLLGRDADALAEGHLALGLLSGPRSLRAATLLADVFEKAGRRTEAADALDEALKKVEPFPLTPSQKKLAEGCRARRDAARR